MTIDEWRIEHDVQPAQRLGRRIGDLTHLLGVGDIDAERRRLADGRRRRRQAAFVDVGDGHRRAFGGEQLRGFGANARCRADDECTFSGK
jgi:hypothetical protein